MKLPKLKSLVLLLLLVSGSTMPLLAQYQFQVIKSGSKALPVTARGIYYALPKTVFKVRLALEEVDKTRGPLAQYTEKYLGTADFIKDNSSYMRLLSVNIEPVLMADNSQVYYVQFPVDRSPKEVRHYGFQLTNEGVLLGFGLKAVKTREKRTEAASSQSFSFSDRVDGFKMRAIYSRRKKTDSIIRKFTIDTVTIKRFLYKTSWVNLSEDDRANDAAQQIKKIRQSRFNLLTGYQEVNYGEGIRYMDEELQKMEQQYLALFLGRESREMKLRNFVFDPENGKLSRELMSYSDANGHVHKVLLKITPVNSYAFPPARLAKPDFIFYRMPVKAAVQVILDGQAFFSDIFTIPQLGVVSTTSLDKTSLRFDPQTGTLIRVEK